MLKDVTLGQYFPGNTVVHRLDPRTKLILVVLYIIALFNTRGWVSNGLILVLTLVCMRVANIRLKNIFKGLKPMLFIIVLTALLLRSCGRRGWHGCRESRPTGLEGTAPLQGLAERHHGSGGRSG